MKAALFALSFGPLVHGARPEKREAGEEKRDEQQAAKKR